MTKGMFASVVSSALLALSILAGSPATAYSQEAARPAPLPTVPLKVTVTVSRFEGEKKTGSLPFVLWVNTGDSSGLQMGTEVPTSAYTTTKDGTTTTSYNSRSLGTNITLSAARPSDDLYKLTLQVNDSQIFRSAGAPPAAGPSIQNFRSTNSLLLRDGQTVQFAVATDKTSGEVIKLDVTLNVVK